jgi:hypothetical protein
MGGYPLILGGDHAVFEQEWAKSGRPDNERPDWPLPSFDAQDWAAAFVKAGTEYGWLNKIDEEIMRTWFANALMRGYDQRSAEPTAAEGVMAELLEALKGVVAIADRKTVEFDRARAAIAKATNVERLITAGSS